jgi:hypothetical protein
MALKLPKEPKNGLAVVNRAIDGLHRSASDALGGGTGLVAPMSLLKANKATLTATVPHTVFDLGAADIAEGHGLQAAKQTGWRYVLEDGGKPFAFAELGKKGDQFNSFNTGPFAEATCAAIAKAEQLDYVRQHDAEVNVLRIAALYVYALWLRGDDGTELVIPIAPVGHELVAGRPYRPEDFLKALQPAAEAALKTTH